MRYMNPSNYTEDAGLIVKFGSVRASLWIEEIKWTDIGGNDGDFQEVWRLQVVDSSTDQYISCYISLSNKSFWKQEIHRMMGELRKERVKRIAS